MLFRFQLGRTAGGGWSFRKQSLYQILHWEPRFADEQEIVYRPSPGTLWHQLGLSALALFIAGVVAWPYGIPLISPVRPPEPNIVDERAQREAVRAVEQFAERLPADVRETMERERHALQQQLQEDLAQRRSTQATLATLALIGLVARSICFWGLIALAFLPLAAFPFQSLTVRRTEEGELEITHGGFWKSTRTWPIGAFDRIAYAIEQETARVRRIRYRVGWRWFVCLRPGAIVVDPTNVPEEPSVRIEFYIDRQKETPHDLSQPPAAVRTLIKQLRRVTGIKTIERLTDMEGTRSASKRTVMRSSFTTEPVVETSTWDVDSLDELPLEVRQKVGDMLSDAKPRGDGSYEAFRVTLVDAEGTQRTYHSLDEMPAETRARYEQLRRRAKRRRRT